MTGALDAALPRLRCPVCLGSLSRAVTRLRCAEGHDFDIARQGYVNLAVRHRADTADTAAMVAARAEFLGRGHYRPIAEAVCDAVGAARFVVDLAGGSGWYLASVLDATGADGVCLDLSTPALRRAGRVHPRAAAVGADAWLALPLGDAVADAVLSIFGPRDPAEIERVLAPGGTLVTVSPEPGHLGELIEPLGMVTVDPRKPERNAAAFARFEPVERTVLSYPMQLSRDDAYAVAAMGPSARHVPDLRARADGLSETTRVGVGVAVTTYRRPHRTTGP